MMVKHVLCVTLSALSLVACSDLTGANDADEKADKKQQNPDPVANTPSPVEISCAYPAGGNFGVAVNMIVPSNKQWDGYAELADTNAPPQHHGIGEYFDCDGSRGINAIMVDTSQFG
jgi:hypothetical protein